MGKLVCITSPSLPTTWREAGLLWTIFKSIQVVLYPLPAVPTYCIVDAYKCPSLDPCLAIQEACNDIIEFTSLCMGYSQHNLSVLKFLYLYNYNWLLVNSLNGGHSYYYLSNLFSILHNFNGKNLSHSNNMLGVCTHRPRDQINAIQLVVFIRMACLPASNIAMRMAW